jgi:anti-sigma factor RsiW
MNAVEHARTGNRIDAYLDGELPPDQRSAVATHLRRCWRCSGYAETVRLIRHSLSGLPRRAPASLAEARLRRLARRLAGTGPTDGPAAG